MSDVTLKKLPRSLVACEVTLAPDVVAAYLDKATERISLRLDLKGFRKGKAPRDVVERAVGAAKLYEEAAYLAIDKKYAAIITEHELRTIGVPDVKILKIAPGNPLVFTITVAVYPEIALPDYKKIASEAKKAQKPVAVDEKEMHDAISWLVQSRRKEATVARAAQKGDLIEVDFEARIAGVIMDGGTSKNHPVVIGESKFIAGFDDALIGMQAGEEKKFSLQVPQDYARENMRGKVIDFSVKANAVREIILPELTDDFAKSLGGFADVAALKENIKSGLVTEKEKEAHEAVRRAALEKLAIGLHVEVPDLLIDQETRKMINEFEHSVINNGLTMTQYLSSIGKTIEDLKKDFKTQAETRVKIALALAEIAKKENVIPTAEEVAEKVRDFVKNLSPEQLAETDPELLNNYVSGIIRNEKVFALLEL